MQLGPGLDQPTLAQRKRPGDEFDAPMV